MTTPPTLHPCACGQHELTRWGRASAVRLYTGACEGLSTLDPEELRNVQSWALWDAEALGVLGARTDLLPSTRQRLVGYAFGWPETADGLGWGRAAREFLRRGNPADHELASMWSQGTFLIGAARPYRAQLLSHPNVGPAAWKAVALTMVCPVDARDEAGKHALAAELRARYDNGQWEAGACLLVGRRAKLTGLLTTTREGVDTALDALLVMNAPGVRLARELAGTLALPAAILAAQSALREPVGR